MHKIFSFISKVYQKNCINLQLAKKLKLILRLITLRSSTHPFTLHSQQQISSFIQSSKSPLYLSLRGEDYGLSAWWLLPVSICIKPIRDEMVPIRPTSQIGNRPAHKKPGGIQWMALLRSAMLLRTERSSPRICRRSWQRLQEENNQVYPSMFFT